MSLQVISLLPLLLIAVLMMLGIVLLVRGWRGDPELSFPTCAGCGYDLRGANLSETTACPECGRSLESPRAVRFGRFRRRPKLMVVGAVMMLAPVLLIGMLLLRTLNRGNPAAVATQSTAAILASLSQNADSPWPWQELSKRDARGELSDAELATALDHLITHLAAQPAARRMPLHWSGDFVEAALAKGRVDDEQRGRLYDAYYGVESAPDVRMRTRVRAGQEAHFTIDTGTSWNLPKVQCLSYLQSARLDDRPLVVSARGGRSEERDVISGGGAFGLDGSFVVDAEPGTHTLTFEVEMGLIDERDVTVGVRHRPGSPERWPATLRRWHHAIAVTIEVLPADQSPVEMVHDASLVAQVRECIKVQRVIVATRAGSDARQHVQVDYWFSKKPPVPLSFDIVVRMDGREERLGSFSASGTGGYSTTGAGRAMAVPDSLEHVDVIFRPNPSKVETTYGMDRIWGEEVVFENVSIERPTDVREDGTE